MSWEEALHLWGAQGAADPCGCGRCTLSTRQGCLTATLPTMSLLWGPRAYVETSKFKVLDISVNGLKGSQLLPSLCRGLRVEEEGP